MLRPDDPELVNCTCIQRVLRPEQAVIFILPKGGYVAFARDCPEHGASFADEVKPDNSPR